MINQFLAYFNLKNIKNYKSLLLKKKFLTVSTKNILIKKYINFITINYVLRIIFFLSQKKFKFI